MKALTSFRIPAQTTCYNFNLEYDQWHTHIDELPQANEARQQLAAAIASKNYDLASIYAGQAVGLVTRQHSAGDVIQHLGEGAERLLRERSSLLLEGHEAAREEQ